MPDTPQRKKHSAIPAPAGPDALSEDENIILNRLPSRFRKVYLELRLLQRETPTPANELRRLARSVFDSVLELRELKETERNALLAEIMASYNPDQMAADSVAGHRAHLLRKVARADPSQLRKVSLVFENRSEFEPETATPTATQLPEIAPERWKDRTTNENPVLFLRRVWGAFLGKSLSSRKQLLRFDAPLYYAVSQFLRQHPAEKLPEFVDLQREPVDSLIARMSDQFSLEEIRRAGSTIERRHQYKRKKQNLSPC